jgi:hypothetical protein
MKLFTQNKKMKQASQLVYNFGIPAFQSQSGLRTCPMAGACVAGCYALSGAYSWSNVQQAFEARLELTQRPDFIAEIQTELIKILKRAKGQQVWIRVHDSGDFYRPEYQLDWFAIAFDFPEIQFYAYTKQINQSKYLEPKRPVNFRLIYSLGGKQDHLIDQSYDRHSKVFETEQELIKQGYMNASVDDIEAPTNQKIGLVYHGAKSFKNTKWSNQ